MLQTRASHSHSAPETRKIFAINRSARYLYLRGSIFYFRYAFPKDFREKFGHSEIRMSLRTGFVHQARKLARHLSACLEGLLMSGEDKTYEELRAEVVAQLEAYLACYPEKHPPSISEIRGRIDRLRKNYMDTADYRMYQPPEGVLFDDERRPQTVSPATWLEHSHRVFLKSVTNDPRQLMDLHYPRAIIELLLEKIFEPDEITKEMIPVILNEYHKMHISLNRIFHQREQGNYAYEREFISSKPTEAVSDDVEQHFSKKEDLLLSNFIKRFMDTKISDGQWTERNIPTHQNRIETLIDILGDIPTASIDRNKMRHFRDILVKLPPNRKRIQEYKNKSIEEILKMDIKATLNIKTVNTTLETISGMFEWGIREGLLEKNPAKDLTLKDERQDIDLRNAFTDEDIKKIFFSGFYNPDDFIKPAYYWVPLIGLYTGMRLEEICQLHTEDILQEDGIWAFDIRTESYDGLNDKILKTKNAIRRIPIHDSLIKLGLLDYINDVSKKSIRLFPELKKTDRSPKYGKQVGKQFSLFLKKRGIDGKKSFHSLRHTFSDYFKKLNLHNDIFRQIFGHEAGNLAAKQYGSKFSVRQCYNELISKISWKNE